MKFKLGEGHFTREMRHLPPGTIIGDDSEHSFDQWDLHGPTADMIPLDDEAKHLYEDTFQVDAHGRAKRDINNRPLRR